MTPAEPNGGGAVGGGVAVARGAEPGVHNRLAPFALRRIDFSTALRCNGTTDVRAQGLEPLNETEEVGLYGTSGLFI